MAVNEIDRSNVGWIRSALGVRNAALTINDRRNRTEDGVRFKFEDTTFGGGKAINQPAAYTEFADMPVGGLLTKNDALALNPEWVKLAGDLAEEERLGVVDRNGVGPTYAEVYMDTGEYVTLRFGLAKQNSLLSFFTSFYNSEAAAYARTGEAPSIFLKVTGAIGSIIGMALKPAYLVLKTVSFLVNKPISRFYYVDPKMHLFWSAANLILNSILVNNGTIPRLNGRNQDTDQLDKQWEVIQQYYSYMPDFFMKNGGVDLRIVATRYNRLALAFQEALQKVVADSPRESGVSAMTKFLSGVLPSSIFGALTTTEGQATNRYIQNYMDAAMQPLDNASVDDLESKVLGFANDVKYDDEGNVISGVDGAVTEIKDDEGNIIGLSDGSTAAAGVNPSWDEYNNRLEKWSFGQKFRDLLVQAYNEGGDFITWRVENTGATSESFSTSTGEAPIASGFNGMSGTARMTRFNMGNFQTGVGFIDMIGSAVGAVVGTVADAVKLEGLKAILGNAFVDIPHVVTGSSAQLPSMSYTMELIPWSNDPITRIMELHAPLAMALAMILPVSTGKQSYNLPLICEAYSRSRITMKVAAVTSMTVTRGTTNLARNADGDPLGVTVSWTLSDLSQIVHMPVNVDMGMLSKFAQGVGSLADAGVQAVTGGDSRYFQAGAAMLSDSTIYDDSTKWTEYMAVLGGLTLQEQIYSGQKLRINATLSMVNFDQWLSVPTAVNYLTTNSVTSLFFGKQWGIFARGTAATN